MNLDPMIVFILVALSALAIVKYVAPAMWKFGEVLYKTIVMLRIGHKHKFSMGRTWLYLPEIMRRAYTRTFRSAHEYEDGFYFDFDTNTLKCETAETQWLTQLALLLRTGANGIGLTVNVPVLPEGADALDGPETCVPVECSLYVTDARMADEGDSVSIQKILVIEHDNRADAKFAHELFAFVRTVKRYRPEIYAFAIVGATPDIDYISTARGQQVFLNDVASRMYVIATCA